MYESNLKGWSKQSTNGHLYKQTCSSSCIRNCYRCIRDTTAVHTHFWFDNQALLQLPSSITSSVFLEESGQSAFWSRTTHKFFHTPSIKVTPGRQSLQMTTFLLLSALFISNILHMLNSSLQHRLAPPDLAGLDCYFGLSYLPSQLNRPERAECKIAPFLRRHLPVHHSPISSHALPCA